MLNKISAIMNKLNHTENLRVSFDVTVKRKYGNLVFKLVPIKDGTGSIMTSANWMTVRKDVAKMSKLIADDGGGLYIKVAADVATEHGVRSLCIEETIKTPLEGVESWKSDATDVFKEWNESKHDSLKKADEDAKADDLAHQRTYDHTRERAMTDLACELVGTPAAEEIKLNPDLLKPTTRSGFSEWSQANHQYLLKAAEEAKAKLRQSELAGLLEEKGVKVSVDSSASERSSPDSSPTRYGWSGGAVSGERCEAIPNSPTVIPQQPTVVDYALELTELVGKRGSGSVKVKTQEGWECLDDLDTGSVLSTEKGDVNEVRGVHRGGSVSETDDANKTYVVAERAAAVMMLRAMVSANLILVDELDCPANESDGLINLIDDSKVLRAIGYSGVKLASPTNDSRLPRDGDTMMYPLWSGGNVVGWLASSVSGISESESRGRTYVIPSFSVIVSATCHPLNPRFIGVNSVEVSVAEIYDECTVDGFVNTVSSLPTLKEFKRVGVTLCQPRKPVGGLLRDGDKMLYPVWDDSKVTGWKMLQLHEVK